MKKKASQVKKGQFIAIDDHLYQVKEKKHSTSGKHGYVKVRLVVVQFF